MAQTQGSGSGTDTGGEAPTPDRAGEHQSRKDDGLDLGSVLYVLGGIPFMIVFFVVLFGLTGACDQRNIMLPF